MRGKRLKGRPGRKLTLGIRDEGRRGYRRRGRTRGVEGGEI